MNSLTFDEASSRLNLWKSNSITLRIMLSASEGPTFDGIITEVAISPGQIVVSVFVGSEASAFDRQLVLRDCKFEGDSSEVRVLFNDGLRLLRLKEAP